jgi:hypothetical protein
MMQSSYVTNCRLQWNKAGAIGTMVRYRVLFEDFSGDTAGSIKAQGFLPYALRAIPDVEHPSGRYTFGVYYADVDLEYEALSGELNSNLDRAVIRWAVAHAEERLRLGSLPVPPPRETYKLSLTQGDLAILRRMVEQKTCEYQVLSGRDLFCSAASADDGTIAGTQGLRSLAPTSGPLCKECNMPDSDFICSRFSHPGVNAPVPYRQRRLHRAFCEEGKPEIETQPGLCYAGGHRCWKRIVEPAAERSPAVPYSPRDLPIALDFLDAIWKQAFGSPLLRLRSVEKTAALSLPCGTRDEFTSRLGDLNELLKLIHVSDNILPREQQQEIDPRHTFKRMAVCLKARIEDGADRENIDTAINDLAWINTVRNKLTHGGSELAVALNQLSIKYPITDYAQAWDQVRSRAALALTTIRSALQGTI